MSEQEQFDLEWDTEDRDRRLQSGELLQPIEDPTEIVVDSDA